MRSAAAASRQEDAIYYVGGEGNGDPPWAWIKCLRDTTDPLKNRPPRCNVELPVELLPWLLLSDRNSAMNLTKLNDHKVTHILSVHAATPREERYYRERLEGTGIVHLRIHCDDAEGYDMIGRHWETCLEFLRRVRATERGRVVVHCMAGINRSGLIACAAHMVLERRPLLSVVRHCLDRRGMVLWNRSFQRQLCDLALRHGLLGPKPEGYDDEPLVDARPPPPPAHLAIAMSDARLKFNIGQAVQAGHRIQGSNPEEEGEEEQVGT